MGLSWGAGRCCLAQLHLAPAFSTFFLSCAPPPPVHVSAVCCSCKYHRCIATDGNDQGCDTAARPELYWSLHVQIFENRELQPIPNDCLKDTGDLANCIFLKEAMIESGVFLLGISEVTRGFMLGWTRVLVWTSGCASSGKMISLAIPQQATAGTHTLSIASGITNFILQE